jgi:hypothetical protein
MTLLLTLFACTDGRAPEVTPIPPSPPTVVDTGINPPVSEVEVNVLLDGEPVADAWVSAGGGGNARTDADGQAVLPFDGADLLIASHAEARPVVVSFPAANEVVELTRFSRTDNLDYVFQDSGEPGDPGTTAECGHCHQAMVIDWDASPHRTSASNPVVQATYAGTSLHANQTDCEGAEGIWRAGLEPGTGQPIDRCYLGDGALPDLNADCGDTVSCDGIASVTAGCADCHAPAIDGVLGGRDLLEAVGRSFEDGVSCDLCHKVESVDLDQPPGVGGALGVLRPSEPALSATEDFRALTFGPFPDVPNPRMSAVERSFFREAEICGACHELDQQGLIPGEALDASRWPDGLPVHSTYTEWLEGPYSPSSPCQSCHMPPDPRWQNAWDYAFDSALAPGVAAGWPRPPGSQRHHSWLGPRTDLDFLGLAAALDLETQVDAGTLTADVTVTNTGAGHAIPTGEPHRAMLLVVEARCGNTVLVPTAGDVVPEFGGTLDVRLASEGWDAWPGAAVGDRIRVVTRAGFRDYVGPGRFGDGSFSVAERGLADEAFLGESVVVAVDGDLVTLDGPLPAGDVAYRVDGVGLPDSGEASRAWAGAPGFAFARILADAEGRRQVPHHRAIDIVSDNRLMPLASFSTHHEFATTCPDPVVTARLVHRNLPLHEARRRAFDGRDLLMAEVSR